MKKIKVVVCEPNKLAYATEINASLASYQRIVGGQISAYYPFDELVCIVCNDEGKINGMSLNRAIKHENKIIEIMAGPFFICDCSGEDFGSLTDAQQKKYIQLFKFPEMFVRSGNEIKAIPYKP